MLDDNKNSENMPIYNRSFLHKNGLLSNCNKNPDKLEGLALKKTKLSLQVVTSDIEIEKDYSIRDFHRQNYSTKKLFKESIEKSENPEITVEQVKKKVEKNNNDEEETGGKVEKPKEEGVPAAAATEKTEDNFVNKKAIDMTHKKSETIYLNKNENIKKNQLLTSTLHASSANFKTYPNWGLTKVIHFHHEQKKKTKHFIKKICSNDNNNYSSTAVADNNNKSELKKLDISSPSNFIYVDGEGRFSWLNQDNNLNLQTDKTLTISAQNNDNDKNLIKSTFLDKYKEDLTTSEKIYEKKMEIIDDKYSEKSKVNQSFLWSHLSKQAYNKKQEITEEKKNDDSGDYDDVGFPSPPSEQNNDDVYDDIALSPTIVPISSLPATEEKEEFQIYDDVMSPNLPKISLASNENYVQVIPPAVPPKNIKKLPEIIKENNNYKIKSQCLFINNNNNNNYSTIGGSNNESFDDPIYDDVIYNNNSIKNNESRVNSIYADGGSFISEMNSIYASRDSDWEDIDESTIDLSKKSSSVVLRHHPSECQSIHSRKKIRWSRNVRRQRSRGSRKNSVRSGKSIARRSTFSDSTSDDSNYETVDKEYLPSILQSTESIQKMKEEEDSLNDDDDDKNLKSPVKPVPPPPRESSLTESLSKRMKMFKRSWSLTKTLGRMRRRSSSTLNEINSNDETLNYSNNQSDFKTKTNQVFNFKRHFQRSLTSKSSLSKFYLDNDNDYDNNLNNKSYSNEEIYESNNWFNRSGSWKNNTLKKNDDCSCSSLDDHNELAEEPLYQYYAAATVRGAFHPDSDDYDDNDDYSTTSLPLTLDMGNLGNRTLWCETRQVLQSGLLERLTIEEKKIQEAKFEILTSEASYLNSLRVLVTEFIINHKLVHEDLSSIERDKLFGQVPNVLISSESFLSELEKIWKNDSMLNGLPEIILQHAEKSSISFINYCSNQVSIDKTLKELKSKKNSTFIDNVRKIEGHPACQSLSLHSFLMLPLQRITRLPLLADAVLSKLPSDNPERTQWEKVLVVLGKIVTDCNEAARNAGRIADMENLKKKIEYSLKIRPIDLSNRYLIRSGPVTTILAKPANDYGLTFRKKYNKTMLYIFLLNDYLLISKIKTNSQDDCYTIIDACKKSLVEVEKVPEESAQFAGKYAMILTLLENYCGKKVEYILSCKNQTERERWIDAMTPTKSSLAGETLYETWDCPQVITLYSYSACQPDELSFQPGEVIKVLRKLPDGWYEGEKLVGGEQGWFPGNYTNEVPSEHVRAKNLRQRHRFMALSESFMQQLAKQPV